MNLKNYIAEIQDFPKDGINFKDISPLLQNPEVLKFAIKSIIENIGNPDKIIGLDARGFIFGSLVAYEMQIPFVMLRKKGKLPGETEKISYFLEYGENVFEIQKNAIYKGEKIAIVDDLLATGGSAKAGVDLVEKMGGKIESLNFVIELGFLNGREKFGDRKVNILINY